MFKGAKISRRWAYNIHGLLLDRYIKLLTILKHTELVHKSVKIDTFYCQSHIKFLFFYPLEQENKLYLEMVLSTSLALFITEHKIQILPANCIWVKLIFFIPSQCHLSALLVMHHHSIVPTQGHPHIYKREREFPQDLLHKLYIISYDSTYRTFNSNQY